MPKENLQISEQSLTNSFLHKFRKSDTRIDQTHDHKDERHLLKRLRYQNPYICHNSLFDSSHVNMTI